MGHLLQPARPDAVGASLVFLHLLEGEAECATQLLLAHSKHLAAHMLAASVGGLFILEWTRDEPGREGCAYAT
jgi:hypothetical protein